MSTFLKRATVEAETNMILIKSQCTVTANLIVTNISSPTKEAKIP